MHEIFWRNTARSRPLPPHDRLKSLPNAARHLKEGVTFEVLDKEALRRTDNQSEQEMQRAKEKLYARFDPITSRSKPPKFHAPQGKIIPKKEARSESY